MNAQPIQPFELTDEQSEAQREALRALWTRERGGWRRAQRIRMIVMVAGVILIAGGLMWLADAIQHVNLVTR